MSFAVFSLRKNILQILFHGYYQLDFLPEMNAATRLQSSQIFV